MEDISFSRKNTDSCRLDCPMPPEGPPELYVKLANPDEPESISRLSLDNLFWEQQKSLAATSAEGVRKGNTKIEKAHSDSKEPVN